MPAYWFSDCWPEIRCQILTNCDLKLKDASTSLLLTKDWEAYYYQNQTNTAVVQNSSIYCSCLFTTSGKVIHYWGLNWATGIHWIMHEASSSHTSYMYEVCTWRQQRLLCYRLQPTSSSRAMGMLYWTEERLLKSVIIRIVWYTVVFYDC